MVESGVNIPLIKLFVNIKSLIFRRFETSHDDLGEVGQMFQSLKPVKCFVFFILPLKQTYAIIYTLSALLANVFLILLCFYSKQKRKKKIHSLRGLIINKKNYRCRNKIKTSVKGCLRYKTITSQNVLSEVQAKNFFIS